MSTKRATLRRLRKSAVTGEMVELFACGRALQAEGKEDGDEYRTIDKRLNITLLRKGWHEVSVLDPVLDYRMPQYMKSLASGRDWHISVGQTGATRRASKATTLRNSRGTDDEIDGTIPVCDNHGRSSPMPEGDRIRIIPHRGVDDDCGSLEVWFADGRKSVRFYWDNHLSRRLSSSTLTQEQAIEKATELAQAEMDKLNPE